MAFDAPGGVERRRHARYELMAQVRVKHGQLDYLMDLVNISLGGALLHLGKLVRPGWLVVGRTLEVGIIHPVDYEPVLFDGRVVRLVEDEEGTSVAVEFDDLGEAGTKAIAQLVKLAIEGVEPTPTGTGRRPPPLPK